MLASMKASRSAFKPESSTCCGNMLSEGKIVVRLKGGDPLVFGRGAEEWAVALEHGVEVELVPGITSAISVPGLAGIPLTFRDVSQGFAVLTVIARKAWP